MRKTPEQIEELALRKPRHTPGPWRTGLKIAAGNREFGIVSENPIFDDDGNPPYHPLLSCAFRGFGRAPREVAEANALAISATPELLAVVKEFLLCGPNAGHNQELIDMAIAALEKAEPVT